MRLSFRSMTALERDLPGSKNSVLAILRAALQAADPAEAVRRALVLRGNTLYVGTQSYDLRTREHIYVVGAGKASAAMAAALEDVLKERISAGWINVKDGYTARYSLPPRGAPTRRITIHEAGHPLPDARGLAGSQQVAELARQAGEKDLVICLISGGGSALMTLPAEGITLSDVEQLTQALLHCGATINEMNAIRKHIEQLKGGQLARLACPAQVVALILSDVIGNPLDVIASGPTSPDPATFADAYAVLHKYELLEKVPISIVRALREGMAGRRPETPKAQSEEALTHTQNVIIASNEHAAKAAVEQAQRLGFNTLFLSTFVEGEAREVGKVLAALARETAHSGQPVPRPACIVAGGETTVTVRGHGLGGRNQELALSSALSIAGLENVAIVSLGTDGSDGPTDAAGAIATGRTVARAAEQGLRSPHDYLTDNDAYHFFQALGDLIITGPTNTNVNDLMFVFAF